MFLNLYYKVWPPPLPFELGGTKQKQAGDSKWFPCSAERFNRRYQGIRMNNWTLTKQKQWISFFQATQWKKLSGLMASYSLNWCYFFKNHDTNNSFVWCDYRSTDSSRTQRATTEKKMVLLHSVTSPAFPVSPMSIYPFKRRLKNVCCQHWRRSQLVQKSVFSLTFWRQ